MISLITVAGGASFTVISKVTPVTVALSLSAKLNTKLSFPVSLPVWVYLIFPSAKSVWVKVSFALKTLSNVSTTPLLFVSFQSSNWPFDVFVVIV